MRLKPYALVLPDPRQNKTKQTPNEKATISVKEIVAFLFGAECRIRTDDLPLTRRVLYQLS